MKKIMKIIISIILFQYNNILLLLELKKIIILYIYISMITFYYSFKILKY